MPKTGSRLLIVTCRQNHQSLVNNLIGKSHRVRRLNPAEMRRVFDRLAGSKVYIAPNRRTAEQAQKRLSGIPDCQVLTRSAAPLGLNA